MFLIFLKDIFILIFNSIENKKELINVILNRVENFIKDTETKTDDKLLLPIIDILRQQQDIDNLIILFKNVSFDILIKLIDDVIEYFYYTENKVDDKLIPILEMLKNLMSYGKLCFK